MMTKTKHCNKWSLGGKKRNKQTNKITWEF